MGPFALMVRSARGRDCVRGRAGERSRGERARGARGTARGTERDRARQSETERDDETARRRVQPASSPHAPRERAAPTPLFGIPPPLL
eukprot:2241930-Prymnesium_polylepis.2